MKGLWLAILLLISGPFSLAGGVLTARAAPADGWVWPKGQGPHPTILIVTSEKGRNSFFERELERWSEEGYALYIVDLLQGRVPVEEKEANRLSDLLTVEGSSALLDKALAKIKAEGRSDPARWGLLSWGTGASHSLRWLRDKSQVRAAALVSANPLREKDELAKIRTRILLVYPGAGSAFAKPDLADFQELLKSAKVPHEWETVPAPSRLFMDFSDRKSFSAKEAQAVQARLTAFFNRHVALRAHK